MSAVLSETPAFAFSDPPASLRVHNALYQRCMTKSELRMKLGLPRMAADRALFELQTRGVVEKGRLIRVGPKRHPVPKWKLTVEGRKLVENRMKLERKA